MTMDEGTPNEFELCSGCWRDGAFPGKLGNIKSVDVDTLPEPGDPAGRSLLTGEEYTYTGERLNLSTGERTQSTKAKGRSKAKDEVASFDKHPNRR